ncbi:MAG TPA: hypothetical protein VN363_09190 [Anaerolineales bacterium]|nr:hypothetical protein [Anaerolineales bacterium]
MGLLQKLASIFSPQSKPGRYYEFTVRCHRCGEQITGRADLYNEVSADFGEDGRGENYYVRKVLMGEGHCFQRIEVELFFDKNRHLVNKEIQGGLFVEESTPPQE